MATLARVSIIEIKPTYSFLAVDPEEGTSPLLARVSVVEITPTYSFLAVDPQEGISSLGAFQMLAFQLNAFLVGISNSGTARVSIIEIRPVYANLSNALVD